MQQRRLVGALVEVAGGGGLSEATVGVVCQRAGVSRRTFYELFEDRDACLLAAVDSALSRLAREVVPEYRGSGTWRERLRAALGALLELFDAEPALARLYIAETLRAGPDVLERRERVLAAVTEAVDEGRQEAVGPVPPLTAQGVVGGALSVVHTHLMQGAQTPLVDLVSSLTAMIVHPYLGPTAAEEELARPSAKAALASTGLKDPFRGLSIRFTYRTARVLAAIASTPGASNREVSKGAGIADDGQTSRLLTRLRDAGLVSNDRLPGSRGERNSWSLTERGEAINATLAG